MTRVRVLLVDDDHLMRAGLPSCWPSTPRSRWSPRPAPAAKPSTLTRRRLHRTWCSWTCRCPTGRHHRDPGATRDEAPERASSILTTFEHDDYIFGAPQRRRGGFLLKRTRPEELIDRGPHDRRRGGAAVALGDPTRHRTAGPATPPDLGAAGSARAAHRPRTRGPRSHGPRASNREIADTLAVEESTVRTHVKRILFKLDLRDRIQAVIYAYENGIIQPRAQR